MNPLDDLTARFPTKEDRAPQETSQLEGIWKAPQGWARITAVNNTIIGVWFVGAAILFFLLAGILALLMRAQLAFPMANVLPQETYNQAFTMHGTVMMFLFAVPAVEAVAVLLLPQMLGARELPFPRLSAYAFWIYLIGGLGFFASIFFGVAPDGGWFMYPPLTDKTHSPGPNADFWLLGIGFIEISAIAGAIEIIVGVLRTRAVGMTLDKMPLFAWGMLVFAVMVLIAFPAVIVATLLLEFERAFDWPFFDPDRGGDPILYQHLFWFFGHPEVYVIFLPASAMMSMLIPTMAQTQIVGYRLVVLSFVATGFLSFGVWAHHMFTTGMPAMSLSFFSAASMAVSIPAGIQVFSWIATIAAGKFRFTASGLFALGGIITFVMGGLTGVMVAMVPFDWQAHDTYFIVAHLHYVLIGGMVFPLFAAFYYWAPIVSERRLSERLGRWAFWLMFTGMHVTFLPMHLTGLMGMPRRVYTYLPNRAWEWPNLISSIGAVLIGIGVLIFLIDLWRNFRPFTGKSAGDVYRGGTLEWLPSAAYATRSLPIVSGRYPLWENPRLSNDVEAGRLLLPNAPTGGREALVTRPIDTTPHYLQTVPGPSVWPFFAALFTAAFFLLLTVSAYGVALICGALAIAGILRWTWDLDRKPSVERAEIGGGVTVPTYVRGAESHGYWGMALTLVVFFMMFLMMAFSYVFLWSRSPEAWAPPPSQLWLLVMLGLAGAALVAARVAGRAARAGRNRLGASALIAATLALGLAVVLDGATWLETGLAPERFSQGAVIYAMTAFNASLVGVGGLIALYAMARALSRRGAGETTFAVGELFFLYLAIQIAAGAAIVRLFPG